MLTLDLHDERWTDFVAARPEATAFHRPEWAAMLAECYAFRPFVLAVAGADGAIEAGIPVLETRRLGRRRWMSLPFTDSCAPLAHDGDALGRLADATARAAAARAVARYDVRAPFDAGGFTSRVQAVTHTLELGDDADAVRGRFNRSQVQRGIARAERDGVVVRRGDTRIDLVETFYALHLRTRRRQGVPVQPRRFFELLWRRVLEPGHGFTLLAYVGERPVAGAVFLLGNETVTYKFGASDPEWLRVRPNHMLFWDAIRWSCGNGYRAFDFGRTDLDNEGLRTFKDGWGAREEELRYSTLGGEAASAARIGRLVAPVLRRSPLWVCRVVGEAAYRRAA